MTTQKLNITHGPWRWQRVGSIFTVTTAAPGGSQCAGVHICTGGNAPGFEPLSAEALTNAARLIAAAPDLLAALEAVAARIELANKIGNPILSAWLPEARGAIAKARGEDHSS